MHACGRVHVCVHIFIHFVRTTTPTIKENHRIKHYLFILIQQTFVSVIQFLYCFSTLSLSLNILLCGVYTVISFSLLFIKILFTCYTMFYCRHCVVIVLVVKGSVLYVYCRKKFFKEKNKVINCQKKEKNQKQFMIFILSLFVSHFTFTLWLSYLLKCWFIYKTGTSILIQNLKGKNLLNLW